MPRSNGDSELEAIIEEKHGLTGSEGRSITDPEIPPQSIVSRLKGKFNLGRTSKPLGELIGDDGINRLGEHETEAVVDERRGLAPHQVGPLTDQAPKPTQPEAPRQPGEGSV